MQNDQLCPVGGRLRAFAHLWPLITSDQFVLQTVTKGYRIEFTGNPPRTKEPRCTPIPRNQARHQDLERGLESMLEKRAIREIPFHTDIPGFYSPIFLVAKESGGWRPILNLKAFNKFVKPLSFRMETLRTVMDCLGEAHQQRLKTSEHLRDSSMSETWAVSIDLRDAYFHVPVAPEHTRFLRFAYDGRAYEFLVLPFGLSTAPRVFTRIVRTIEAFLKIQGVDMHQYLDDWLLKNQSRSLVERQRDLTLFWVTKLGFLVNEGKSQLIPTQFPAFLGSTLDLINMLVFPSEKRVIRASRLASSLLARSPQPAKTWQKLLGHLSSLRELVPMAVTHTRLIQLMLHSQWTQVSDSPYLRIYPDHESLRELEWWASRANLTVGRPFLRPDPTMTIVTDASMEGWGGHLGDWVISGQWPRAWAKHHINWLELQAVWLTLQHFLPQVRDTAVDVLTDNTTTVAYINKEGGTQSPTLCYLALDLWAWCRQHGIYLVANHISGVRNVLADALSRGKHNHPQDSGSAHIRALADSPCGSLRVREEPQTSSVLLSAPLSDVVRNKRSDAELGESVRVRVPADQPHPEGIEETEAAVVSPDPPSSPVLAQPAVVPSADQHADRPSASDHTQGQPPEELGHGDVLPQTGQNETGCMAAVRKSFVDRGFSQGVAETAARARRESTCRLYDSRLLHYRRWCVERGVGPAEAPVAEVAEFLNGLRTVKHKGKPLAPSTIAGYKSAIAAIHRGFPDGTTVSSNTDLSTLIKGLFVVSARPRTLNETWDLPTVLKYLAGPPFEPIHTAPLRSVAVKTAFLLQLASARRGSWVHSCRIDACHLRWENGGVRLLPSLLLDKNQSVSFTPSEVFLLSLKEFSPDDKVHCPVRALKWYLELTKPLRGDEKALFIRSREPYTKATKSTVAGWVKEAIAGAFSHLPKERRQRMGIRAHDTRGVATTWATMAGVPFEAIMDAAAWSRPQTFAQFYLKDLPATKGRFSRAVLVTAGTASRK